MSTYEQGSPDDLWVLVMGVTGTGKSTFIQCLTDEYVHIGHTLESATVQVQAYACKYQDKPIVWLIDTPGLDDSSRGDLSVVEAIITFLISLYARGIRLAGLLYLHRITDVRFSGTAKRSLELFKAMIGNEAYESLRFVTTFWDARSQPEEYEIREKSLRQILDSFLKQKVEMLRFEPSDSNGAQHILKSLLQSSLRVPLLVQNEMHDLQLPLGQTSVGKVIGEALLEQREKNTKMLELLKDEMRQALLDKDKALEKELQEEKARREASHAQLAWELERLSER